MTDYKNIFLNAILGTNVWSWVILIILAILATWLILLILKLRKSDSLKNGEVNEETEIEEYDEDTSKNSKNSAKVIIAGIILIITVLCFAAISFLIITKEKPNENENSTEPLAQNESSDENIHYLGILPLQNPSTMLEQFSGVEQYLRDKTGLNIKLRLYPTSGEIGGYTAVVKDVSKGNISFAYLASVTTVQANGNGPVIPFACAQNKGSATYRGDLAVKIDSSYRTLSDLKGKKVSGTSKSSTSGNLMPSAMLKQRGIDEKTYFDGGMMYLGSHDKAAQAVLAGTIDACFINEATLNKYNAETQVLRSIWKHDSVPEFPFVVNTDKVTPEELVKVKNALLKMHETNIQGIQSINKDYEKWVAIDWEDYLGIKNAIDEVYGPVFYNLDEWGKE